MNKPDAAVTALEKATQQAVKAGLSKRLILSIVKTVILETRI